MKHTGLKRTLSAVVAVVGLLMVVIAGQAPADAQGADDPGQVEAGANVFAASCAGCHGADGSGVAGLGRPLTGIASQGDRATHIGSITNGKGNMPAFGERLSADEIDQAASYVRLTFVEAAAETTSQPELAITGLESTGLAIAGFTMLVAGAQLVLWTRKQS